MEVNVSPRWEDMKPISVTPPGLPGSGISAYLTLKLINHRTDRLERIIGSWIELRQRHMILWNRTLAKVPFAVESQSDSTPKPITDINLPQMGAPQTYLVEAAEGFGDFKMPKKSELVIVFKMVGPMRKYIKRIAKVKYHKDRGNAEVRFTSS